MHRSTSAVSSKPMMNLSSTGSGISTRTKPCHHRTAAITPVFGAASHAASLSLKTFEATPGAPAWFTDIWRSRANSRLSPGAEVLGHDCWRLSGRIDFIKGMCTPWVRGRPRRKHSRGDRRRKAAEPKSFRRRVSSTSSLRWSAGPLAGRKVHGAPHEGLSPQSHNHCARVGSISR